MWGVQPYILDEVTDTDHLIGDLDATLLEKGLADEGDRLVVLMGAPTRRMGSTNLMLVYRLGQYRADAQGAARRERQLQASAAGRRGGVRDDGETARSPTAIRDSGLRR